MRQWGKRADLVGREVQFGCVESTMLAHPHLFLYFTILRGRVPCGHHINPSSILPGHQWLRRGPKFLQDNTRALIKCAVIGAKVGKHSSNLLYQNMLSFCLDLFSQNKSSSQAPQFLSFNTNHYLPFM